MDLMKNVFTDLTKKQLLTSIKQIILKNIEEFSELQDDVKVKKLNIQMYPMREKRIISPPNYF